MNSTPEEANEITESTVRYLQAFLPDATGIVIIVTTDEYGHVASWPPGKEALQRVFNELEEHTGVTPQGLGEEEFSPRSLQEATYANYRKWCESHAAAYRRWQERCGIHEDPEPTKELT